jgi:hypothetical protein
VLAEETRCRSSAGCQEPAGHGRWGQFCAVHAAELNAITKRPAKFNGRERAPKDAEPEPAKPQRVSREQTAAKVAAVVKEADGPISAVEICARLGTTKGNNSIRRAIESTPAIRAGSPFRKDAAGWLATRSLPQSVSL